jgi:hypothetical protein
MLNRVLIGWLLAGVLNASGSAFAGVQLSIRDGRVWLKAERARVADILAEWARVGQTEVVNGQRAAGPPLTITLNGVPELDALDIIMRSAGGFMTMSRTDLPDSLTASRFSRVVIVPFAAVASSVATSSATPPASPVPSPPAPAYDSPEHLTPLVTESGAQRVLGPDGQPVPDDQEGAPPPRPAPPTAAPAPGVITPPARRPGGAEPIDDSQ